MGLTTQGAMSRSSDELFPSLTKSVCEVQVDNEPIVGTDEPPGASRPTAHDTIDYRSVKERAGRHAVMVA